jgi:hypothetical protein
MRRLLDDPAEARRLGEGARRRARERYGIERFVRDWEATFAQVTGQSERNGVLATAGAATGGESCVTLP